MPLYDYRCLRCENEFQAFNRIRHRLKERCPACHGTCEIVFLPGSGMDAKARAGIFKPFVDDRPTGEPVLYTSRRKWLKDLHRAGYTSVFFEGKKPTDNTGRRPKETIRDLDRYIDHELLDIASRARPETDEELAQWARRAQAEAKGRAKGH